MNGRRALAALLAITFAATGVAVGIRTGFGVVDVDEVVFRDTLRQMRDGDGYYPAMRDALTAKEGRPPSEVRSVRPPTMFLLLRLFPEPWWRYVVGIVYAGIVLGAWALGAPFGRWGAPAAAALAGIWVVGASSFLFLHAELWALPFLLAGSVRARGDRDGSAAALIAGATIVRELYGVGLIAGAIVARRRAPWMIALAAVAALGVAHVALASDVTVAGGREAALGNEPITGRGVLTFLSPGNRPAGWVLGAGMLVAGITGLVRNVRTDRAARLLLPFVLVLVPAGVLATRSYWNLTWGPVVASFAAGAFARARES